MFKFNPNKDIDFNINTLANEYADGAILTEIINSSDIHFNYAMEKSKIYHEIQAFLKYCIDKDILQFKCNKIIL